MLQFKSALASAVILAAVPAARADFALGVAGHPDSALNFGFVVLGVAPGFAADQMGVQAGDVIFNVNGSAISTAQDLRDAVNASGGRVTVSWLRGTSTLARSATLADLGDGAGAAAVKAPGGRGAAPAKASKATNIKVATPAKTVPHARKK